MTVRAPRYFTTVQGLSVPVWRSGRGPAALILPGRGMSGGYYYHLVDALSEDHQVVTTTLPGFARRASLPKGWWITDYVRFVSQFLSQELPGESCLVIGHSFGGMVGTLLAEFAPFQVSELVLVNPAGLGYHRSLLRLTLRWFIKQGRDLRHPAAQAIWRAQGLGVWREALTRSGDIIRAGRMMANTDILPTLLRLPQPKQVLWGDRDRLFPVGEARQRLLDLGLDLPIEVLPGRSHEWCLINPGPLVNFLRRHESR